MQKDYTDFNYQDISNVVLETGILRSTVRCILRFGGEPLELNDLPNSDAAEAYGMIRENAVRYQSPLAATIPPSQASSSMSFQSSACRKCGHPLVEGQLACVNCGTPV